MHDVCYRRRLWTNDQAAVFGDAATRFGSCSVLEDLAGNRAPVSHESGPRAGLTVNLDSVRARLTEAVDSRATPIEPTVAGR